MKKCDGNILTLSVFLFTQLLNKTQEYEKDALWSRNHANSANLVLSNNTDSTPHKDNSFCWFQEITWGLRHGWHPLTNTGKSTFLYKVWFMFSMCHYERNVPESGHHTYVEKHTDHSACLPGINLKVSVMGNLYNVSWGVKGHLVKRYLSRTRCWERGQEEDSEWE